MPTTTLKKWGNSQGIIIPKSYCEKMDIKPGDRIQLAFDGDRVIVEPEKEHTLTSLMKDYTGSLPEEFDWGKPMGKELW